MNGRERFVVTALGGALAVVLLSRLLAHTDAAAMLHAVASAGALVVVAPLPFALSLAVDSYATNLLLRALGNRTTLAQVLPVRLASEALHLSVPAGFVASDTVTAVLLDSRADVPMRDGVVAAIARRWLMMRAHAGYIAFGALFGFSALAALSARLLGGPGLVWALVASAVVPLGASFTIGAGVLGRSTFTRLQALCRRVPSDRARRWVESRRCEASATDAQVARLRAAPRATTAATLGYFACWCVEALDSALVLHLVGGDVSLRAVFAVEAGLTLVRSLAVIAPSGLGVVDVGYATVLPALGVDANAAAAFVVLKRGKELAWVAAGYAVLGWIRARAAGRARAAAPALAGST